MISSHSGGGTPKIPSHLGFLRPLSVPVHHSGLEKWGQGCELDAMEVDFLVEILAVTSLHLCWGHLALTRNDYRKFCPTPTCLQK